MFVPTAWGFQVFTRSLEAATMSQDKEPKAQEKKVASVRKGVDLLLEKSNCVVLRVEGDREIFLNCFNFTILQVKGNILKTMKDIMCLKIIGLGILSLLICRWMIVLNCLHFLTHTESKLLIASLRVCQFRRNGAKPRIKPSTL